MKVFVAGGSGVIGRRLVRKLVDAGHRVTASATSIDKVRP
jgi:nucleoside-diphosphate-sugar epimerase